MPRRLIATSIAVTIALTASACADPIHASYSGLDVTGYAEAGSTTDARLRASSAVTIVGVDGVNLTDDGSGITAVDPAALHLLKAAHAMGKRAELLLGNFDGAINDFSPEIATRLLGSAANIRSVSDALAAEVAKSGWDGVTIDLESLTGDDAQGLSGFVKQLRSALGPKTSISICVMATTGEYSALGYDLASLAGPVDHIVLMAYDEHGPGWSKAGPVGGMPWVRTTLKPLTATVAPEKIQLGIAGYGYTWPVSGDGEQVSDRAARALIANPAWSDEQQEWYGTLHDGTTVWWSDARSIASRVALARQLGLGGVAVWSLGLSDPLR